MKPCLQTVCRNALLWLCSSSISEFRYLMCGGGVNCLEWFCLVAERLWELPALESVAERMISHMAALFHASRFSAQPELIDAQIAVRAQELCNEYRSTAGRDRPCNRIQIHKKLHFLNTYTQLEDESLEIRSSSGIDKWSRYHASIPVKSESFCVHLEK